MGYLGYAASTSHRCREGELRDRTALQRVWSGRQFTQCPWGCWRHQVSGFRRSRIRLKKAWQLSCLVDLQSTICGGRQRKDDSSLRSPPITHPRLPLSLGPSIGGRWRLRPNPGAAQTLTPRLAQERNLATTPTSPCSGFLPGSNAIPRGESRGGGRRELVLFLESSDGPE